MPELSARAKAILNILSARKAISAQEISREDVGSFNYAQPLKELTEAGHKIEVSRLGDGSATYRLL